MELMEHQQNVLHHLGNGKVLYGVVGSGKSATVLAYYSMYETPKDIYVITTAKKRDSLDWEREAASFGIGTERDATLHGTITIDSWNNIGNYIDRSDAFFIFDEQRLVGHGAWVKAFLKIAKKNRWMMLSGTPGDDWLDYAPLFIANGFYKNITQFKLEHVMYEPYRKYPKVRMYLGVDRLEYLRNEILVEMPYVNQNERIMNFMDVGHDSALLKKVYKERWHVYENRPVKDVAELFRVMRKIVNSDPSRLDMVLDLIHVHPRLIIFYNFNYELEILRTLQVDIPVYEWNGHRKDDLPDGDRWVYLVQYVAGSEGWNCTTTDATILYSLTYSYKNYMQSLGRIDRLDTPYKKLYYYIFTSNSIVDRGIRKSLENKKSFNERKYLKEFQKNNGEEEVVWEETYEICQI